MKHGIFGFLSLAVLASPLSASALAGEPPKTLTIDYATYNPLSIVLKEKGWVEEAFAKDGTKIEWVFSLGSNKALELLNSKSTDFGSSAGVAAFISKANGNPIKSIYVASKPEWTALLVAKDSKIKSVADLKGKKVAATKGTDPYVFLARALDLNGLSIKDIEHVSLQHHDGKTALLRGDVDAWASLDPLFAQAELDAGARILYRNPDFNTYDVISVREAFASKYPEAVEKIIGAYEKARKWAKENPEEYRKLFAAQAKLNDAVAAQVIGRTDIADGHIGEAQAKSIAAAAEVLKKSGTIDASANIDAILKSLIDPQYADKAIK